MIIEVGDFVFWPNKENVSSHQFGRLLHKGKTVSTIFINARFGGKIVTVPTVALNLLNTETIKIFGPSEKIAWVESRIQEMRETQPVKITQPFNTEEFNELTQKIFRQLKEIKELHHFNWSSSTIVKTAKHLAYQEKNQLFLKQLNIPNDDKEKLNE